MRCGPPPVSSSQGPPAGVPEIEVLRVRGELLSPEKKENNIHICFILIYYMIYYIYFQLYSFCSALLIVVITTIIKAQQ